MAKERFSIDEKAPTFASILHNLDEGNILRQLEEFAVNLPKLAQERGGKPSINFQIEFGKFDSQKVFAKGKLAAKEPEQARTEAIFYVTDEGLSRENPLQRRLAIPTENE